MPLLVFLKQPERIMVVKGDKKYISEVINSKHAKYYWLEQIDKGEVFIPLDNISYIEEISDKELQKRKEDFMKKQKLSQQQAGNITMPNFRFPGNKKRN